MIIVRQNKLTDDIIDNNNNNNNNKNKNKNKMTTTTSYIANISEQELRLKISNLVLKFSTDNFKFNLKKIIDALTMVSDTTHIPLVNHQRIKI